MECRVKHLFNFTKEKLWSQGFYAFGFHGKRGSHYMLQYDEHWLGYLTAEDRFLWTAGAVDKGLSSTHIPFNVKYPHYISELPDGPLLVSSNGTNEIFKIWPD